MRTGLWLYFNVGTPTSGYSENTDAAGIGELAKEVKEKYPDEPVELEIVLMDGEEIFYQDDRIVSERVILIP